MYEWPFKINQALFLNAPKSAQVAIMTTPVVKNFNILFVTHER
jgi:hypothetical protein